MTTQITIVDGPSKFDLMTALFVWKPERLKVMFVAENGDTYKATIRGCEAEDGSGECWIIRGYSAKGDSQIAWPFEGFFRTNSRKGHLVFNR